MGSRPAGDAAGQRIDWSSASDEAVMADVKAGSADAFAVLYDRFHTQAFRIAWSVVHDEGRAQEAVQEAFISIWRTCANYQDRGGKVAPWLLTVTRNRAIDIGRRHHPHRVHRASDVLLDAVPAEGSVSDTFASRARACSVVAALTEIPEPQREVIALAFYGELTHTEIAEHLEIPLGTVKGRMRLGMDRLRAALPAS